MEPKGKKIKRHTLIPHICSRCGNDLMTGSSLFHLPFEKRYICFCNICHMGLGFPLHLLSVKTPTNEEWKKFWDEEIYGR